MEVETPLHPEAARQARLFQGLRRIQKYIKSNGGGGEYANERFSEVYRERYLTPARLQGLGGIGGS